MNNYIKTFQSANDLVADGIIGKKTLAKFKEILELNNEELAHFLGQCAHESGNFTITEENLNYSAARLRIVFPRHFEYLSSFEYEHEPEKIANRVYANRMGNGDILSGDGFKYRGRGLIQLTGRDNYTAFAKYVGDESIIDNPELVSSKYILESALWYFNRNNIWKYADVVDYSHCLAVSRAINIGNPNSSKFPNGFDNRFNKTIECYNKLLIDNAYA